MDSVIARLNTISAGRILDVGAGQGGSVKTLVEYLKDFESIIGVDIEEKHVKRAEEQFADDPRISFRVMSAENLKFPDNSFDTVTIVWSLHHMNDAAQSLLEMKRVLKPGGLLIIFEMHQDSPTPKQLTHILWHHLGSEMDSILGISHHTTFRRDELIQLVKSSGIIINELIEPRPDEAEEKSKDELDATASALDIRVEMLAGRPEYEHLKAKVEEVKKRIYETGIQPPPALVMFCSKQR